MWTIEVVYDSLEKVWKMKRYHWFRMIAAATFVLFAPFAPFVMQSASCVAGEPEDKFEAPVCLKVGDDPINQTGRLMYPSPAIFDVDNDGQDELVIGTIFGRLVFSKNTNASAGDPVWSEPEPIETTEGEPLKLNNW